MASLACTDFITCKSIIESSHFLFQNPAAVAPTHHDQVMDNNLAHSRICAKGQIENPDVL
jgi:hypothetical protein